MDSLSQITPHSIFHPDLSPIIREPTPINPPPNVVHQLSLLPRELDAVEEEAAVVPRVQHRFRQRPFGRIGALDVSYRGRRAEGERVLVGGRGVCRVGAEKMERWGEQRGSY